jgi:hypothetical protein
MVQLVKVVQARELPEPKKFANYLLSQERNANLARARIHTLRELLEAAERYLAE